jgi:hypothetical protein
VQDLGCTIIGTPCYSRASSDPILGPQFWKSNELCRPIQHLHKEEKINFSRLDIPTAKILRCSSPESSQIVVSFISMVFPVTKLQREQWSGKQPRSKISAKWLYAHDVEGKISLVMVGISQTTI